MDTENIFNQNVDYLIQIRDEVVQCNQLEQHLKQLNDKQDKLRKAVSQEEKSIHDEIMTTIKKRKNEIEKTYDDQLDAGRKKIKKAQDAPESRFERLNQMLIHQEMRDAEGLTASMEEYMKYSHVFEEVMRIL